MPTYRLKLRNAVVSVYLSGTRNSRKYCLKMNFPTHRKAYFFVTRTTYAGFIFLFFYEYHTKYTNIPCEQSAEFCNVASSVLGPIYGNGRCNSRRHSNIAGWRLFWLIVPSLQPNSNSNWAATDFFPHPFQFIIHWSSYHSVLCSLKH